MYAFVFGGAEMAQCWKHSPPIDDSSIPGHVVKCGLGLLLVICNQYVIVMFRLKRRGVGGGGEERQFKTAY